MRTRDSSLQFCPPFGPDNPALPVVACGLGMDTAKLDSAYIFSERELFERAGSSQLSIVRQQLTRHCPLETDLGLVNSVGCIYRVNETDGDKRLTYGIPSGGTS